MSQIAHAPLLTLRSSARTVHPHPAPAAVADSPLSLQQRAAALDAEIRGALADGAELESHTATVAVLVCPDGKPHHVARLLLAFMSLRLGLFTRAVAENATSSRVMLTVDECGNVTRWMLPR